MVQNFRVKIFLNELILLINKDALNWSKVTVKTFIILQNIFFQINAAVFKLSIDQTILEKIITKNITQYNV